MGKNIVVGKPIVKVPAMNTNMVIPSSGTGQPSWFQPTFSQTSWGYTYPRNRPAVVNHNYQPTTSRVIYLGMPYPGNMYTPWGKPNWSNVLAPGGPLVNTTGGYGVPPYGVPPPGGPPFGGTPYGVPPPGGPPYGAAPPGFPPYGGTPPGGPPPLGGSPSIGPPPLGGPLSRGPSGG